MSIKGKIEFRIYIVLGIAFVVLGLAIGFLYSLLLALFAFALWKAYSYSKLMNWWKRESALSRQIIEFVSDRLNEGVDSQYFWVRSLTVPEVMEFAKTYRVELMARPLIIEKSTPNLIEGWTDWGSSRLEECVLSVPAEELGRNVGSAENPIPMMRVMIAKAAFEIIVAEHALQLLSVSDPRQTISQRVLSRQIETLNSKSGFARAFDAEKAALATKLLGKELGETAA